MIYVYAYMIATHGPRKLHNRHPALRQQIANLKAFAAIKDAKPQFNSDYARLVRGLEDLPVLRRCLQIAIENSGTFVMDDLSRLFRPCVDQAARDRLEVELGPFAAALYGIRQKASFADLPDITRSLVTSAALSPKFVLAPTPRERRSISELRDQTEAANTASAQARKCAADKKANDLAGIRDALASAYRNVTNKMIADRANDRGLRTTRGNHWRPDTVARALKRLNTGGS